MTRAIAHDAAMYVTAATQQMRALAHLLGPEIILTGWPVTRAVAEHCGRAAWLLGTDAEPMGRVARYYMEWIASISFARSDAKSMGKTAEARELSDERDAVLVKFREVISDAELFVGKAPTGDWTVGGESYAALAKAVSNFGRDALNGKGLYDGLSSFSHPSLYRLRQQTRTTELDDRTHHGFTAQPENVQWQFAVASGSVYRAAHHVVAYLGLDETPLEVWADRQPALLGWSQAGG
ncbi:hypothetical protein [Ruania halotolerans]|uniref:hypothetical protein n=1 Tax=Ruania halotolerans TaxID=2897773 RepID=UPI001E64249A|nr:hypothetical protein [Ruania halotolerans]UFU05493.1 hypothetical protein LQF10_13695 [Ruania halotolerans]